MVEIPIKQCACIINILSSRWNPPVRNAVKDLRIGKPLAIFVTECTQKRGDVLVMLAFLGNGLESDLRDEATMKQLWDFAWATQRKEYGQMSCKRKVENPAKWAGFVIHMMLRLLYLVSIIYLLRYHEALRITWANITFKSRKMWSKTTGSIHPQI